MLIEREKLELDVRSRLLFTYRKGFKPIGEASDGRSDFVVASELSQEECGKSFMSILALYRSFWE